MSEMKFRVFIINEDVYSENYRETGASFEKFGAWFDLPIEPSELGKVIFEKIGASSKFGYTIVNQEIETGISAVDDYDYTGEPIWQTNNDAYEVLREIYNLDGDDKHTIDALVYSGEYTLHDALDRYDNFYWHNSGSWDELGREIAENSDVAVDDELADYVDWESYAKDTTNKVYFCGDGCAVSF